MRLRFAQGEDMTAHNSEASIEVGVKGDVNDAFSKVSFPFHEAENSSEVISPHKPKKEFRASSIVEEHKPAQKVCKMQNGKRRLKRAAREKGQAHSQEIESKNQTLGSKQQGSMVFTECEENIVHKKQCGGFTGNLNELNLLAVAARQHHREP